MLLVVLAALARPIATLMGGDGEILDAAARYLRIASLGAPFFMLASAGQGFLRGMSDLRTPLVILIVAHAANVVLELLFVYGFGWGLDGLGVGHGDRPGRHGQQPSCACRRSGRAGSAPCSRASAR